MCIPNSSVWKCLLPSTLQQSVLSLATQNKTKRNKNPTTTKNNFVNLIGKMLSLSCFNLHCFHCWWAELLKSLCAMWIQLLCTFCSYPLPIWKALWKQIVIICEKENRFCSRPLILFFPLNFIFLLLIDLQGHAGGPKEKTTFCLSLPTGVAVQPCLFHLSYVISISACFQYYQLPFLTPVLYPKYYSWMFSLFQV